MPSPFAAERLPDGRRRYSRSAVVARRRLLAGIVVAGAGAAVGVGRWRDGGGSAVADAEEVAGTSALHSTSEAASPWVVVNKQHPIDPADYAPASLVTVGDKQVAGVVGPDLTALLAAATADGVGLTLTSGYRSLDYQRTVHEQAVARDGRAAAERVSARPGYSEHQTGLAVDFGSSARPECAVQDCYRLTPEARWLAAHAGDFGFLLRYTEQNSAVTGYAPESWHYRWVGRELLERMAERGVTTLEEFFGVSGGAEYA
ncbi:M15 family metallopeptidase [Kineococcus glutinatus]|uniref:D-alanyl-D-alanine carboxypeptidase-like core domain-containing protein n=1 Tax=Kineococcus glutinatus TaxID=1070872 RepID=A0ABP9I710_9ACTN